eukprot:CAMPEP_0114346058 /NCGR_PEP_ID=MMETSP0101-20121206/12767_1 /TAXON_ID=38822 ORGANISM="Pteridomonas danica, Strain PT" /NCGR_SAMPLE_ID=MMETSP0101 /ASSEMBLY_ACC=CAM_ASM_000211 /LENGTH=30 /DNA_ID= /DNA_START= /DNA_END= /DNA_ORIENTATION=
MTAAATTAPTSNIATPIPTTIENDEENEND